MGQRDNNLEQGKTRKFLLLDPKPGEPTITMLYRQNRSMLQYCRMSGG